MLAKNSKTPRSSRMHALSLTFFASKLAPTSGVLIATSRPWAYPKNKAATNSSARPRPRITPPTHIHTHTPVGASLLAKNSKTPRSSRMHALSLTFFASKLAPTSGVLSATSRPWAYPKNKAATNSSARPPPSNNPPHTHTPVGASLLAKNSKTPRSSRMHALSLTFFASKLAPTSGVLIRR
ncbi:hypothetical protein PVE_R1G4986 [Pseudomonas veronii 1YdBTEX2]|uniref:Uncharacterized protein n=1 Tax=Pseudomonas veronii 1YdBTEX2 TaxID=1295141 RepID=A0A1D3K3H8_PSEVE|nr:hypothetical protein PVE_R1G4986 [Pseudomonas veronii 1YdBTEX2]